jgi:hypothetical protein
LASTRSTFEAFPICTVSPTIVVPSSMTTFLPSRMRPPDPFAPTAARRSPSLLNRPSRATRKGTPGQTQTTGRVVVLVVEVEVVVVVGGRVVVVIELLVVVVVVLVVVVVVLVVVVGAHPAPGVPVKRNLACRCVIWGDE